jgi:hypothetical protein
MKRIAAGLLGSLLLTAFAPIYARTTYAPAPLPPRILRNSNLIADAPARALDSQRERLQYGRLGRANGVSLLEAHSTSVGMLRSLGFVAAARHPQNLYLIRTRVRQPNGETWDGYYAYDSVTHFMVYEMERYVFPPGARRSSAVPHR